jgi:deazaflavin-dependent oxidoreductase (nitroreductase family)
MSDTRGYDHANALQKSIRSFASSGPGSWLFVRVLHHVDRPVNRLTRGRHTLTSALSGLPVVLLTTTGAKSGQPRTVPLVAIPMQDELAIIASNFGQERHPAWYYNLRAHPEAEIVIHGVRRKVRGIEADGERRDRVWQEGLRVYPGFDQYERRASHRDICVFVLEPA